MKTVATNRKIRVLITAIRDGTLVPRPEFQRRLVWSNRHKTAFLDTVLRGYPFPEIYIAAGEVNADTAQGSEMLVDGQQRITTLHQYFTASEELGLGEEVAPYASLPKEKKEAFLEYEVVVRDLGQVSLDEIREVFQRINSTKYSLNAMEIHNARYDGEFKSFGEKLAEYPFFESHRVFDARDIRRMHDVRFCLVYAATVMSSYFDGDTELESYLQQYNDEFANKVKLEKRTERVLSAIDQLELAPESRVWRKPDLFTLMVEMYRALVNSKLKPDTKTLSAKLSKFYGQVNAAKAASNEEIASYSKASLQGTNHRGNRILRGKVVRALIEASVS